MDLVPFIQPDWVEIDLHATSSTEVIRKLGRKLVDSGRIHAEYLAEVVEREALYPTGLPTEGVPVALPHATATHVVRSGLAIAVLRDPVSFAQMGSPDQTLAVKIVFLLAVQDPSAQVPALQQLVTLFQDGVTLPRLAAATSREGAYQILLDGLEAMQGQITPEL